MLTAAVLGSCRVHTPVRMLARDRIRTDHEGAEWYTHSTRDALQKLKIVRRQLDLPAKVVPLVVESHAQKWNPARHHPTFYGRADVFVVEICSRKIATNDGIYYQQWPTQMVVREPERYPELVGYVEGATQRIQSREELLGDLKLICDRLGRPVLFVPHLNVKMSNGQPFPERTIIRDTLEQFCRSDRRASLFDPTAIVAEHGEAQALVDSGHYREEFYPVLADRMFSALSTAASISSAAPA
ncbi:hypothetical protein [Devosia sp. CN2-171]|uniref:hypothetical protein n=1 Tax=Devosia sp. CN2-171 TaxID=3400909 RepID=UPI003BF8B8FF